MKIHQKFTHGNKQHSVCTKIRLDLDLELLLFTILTLTDLKVMTNCYFIVLLPKYT